jgi:hypothetical protein
LCRNKKTEWDDEEDESPKEVLTAQERIAAMKVDISFSKKKKEKTKAKQKTKKQKKKSNFLATRLV